MSDIAGIVETTGSQRVPASERSSILHFNGGRLTLDRNGRECSCFREKLTQFRLLRQKDVSSTGCSPRVDVWRPDVITANVGVSQFGSIEGELEDVRQSKIGHDRLGEVVVELWDAAQRVRFGGLREDGAQRSEEHTSELQYQLIS